MVSFWRQDEQQIHGRVGGAGGGGRGRLRRSGGRPGAVLKHVSRPF